jgi:hypothetical protein
LGVILAKSL